MIQYTQRNNARYFGKVVIYLKWITDGCRCRNMVQGPNKVLFQVWTFEAATGLWQNDRCAIHINSLYKYMCTWTWHTNSSYSIFFLSFFFEGAFLCLKLFLLVTIFLVLVSSFVCTLQPKRNALTNWAI